MIKFKQRQVILAELVAGNMFYINSRYWFRGQLDQDGAIYVFSIKGEVNKMDPGNEVIPVNYDLTIDAI